jgi:hypothetical protein
MLISMLLAVLTLAGPAPPAPDPYPNCQGGWCQITPVTYIAYDIDVPAINQATGKVIPNMHFTCHVPVRWHGKPNRWGHETCVLKDGPLP